MSLSALKIEWNHHNDTQSGTLARVRINTDSTELRLPFHQLCKFPSFITHAHQTL